MRLEARELDGRSPGAVAAAPTTRSRHPRFPDPDGPGGGGPRPANPEEPRHPHEPDCAHTRRCPRGRRRLPAVVLALALGLAPMLAVAAGQGPSTAVAASPERPTFRPPAAPMPAARPLRVVAPAVDLDAPLVAVGLDSHGGLAPPPDAATAGWYTGGPTPGSRGPAVLTGHVDLDHRPGAFAVIARLRPGDVVDVARADGSTARFEVQTVRRVSKQHFPTAQVYGDLPGAGLRLVTCGGAFDRAARSYVDNVVVWAALVTAEA